jgi:S-adenosylmethionine synthetase
VKKQMKQKYLRNNLENIDEEEEVMDEFTTDYGRQVGK